MENLNIFKEENTLALLKPKIDYLREALKEFWNIPTVYDIRQLGFMVGIEIRKPNGEPFSYGERIGFKIAYKAREKGVFLRPLGDVMVLMMPLIIEYNEINQVLEALKWSIEEITSKYFR